jgi:hypothetical protein
MVVELIKQDNKRTTMTAVNNTTGPYRQLAKVVAISTFVFIFGQSIPLTVVRNSPLSAT